MNYELAKELRDAGFPVPSDNRKGGHFGYPSNPNITPVWFPSLSELIEACGDNFRNINRDIAPEWQANAYKTERGDNFAYGLTPEEAVARLWLVLNKKP